MLLFVDTPSFPQRSHNKDPVSVKTYIGRAQVFKSSQSLNRIGNPTSLPKPEGKYLG